MLNKPDVGVKRLRRLAIQPEDKAAHDLEALRLQGVYGMERVLRVVFAHVLGLFGGDERRGCWRLNAHEDGGKARLDHRIHELVVLHEIHAGFGREGKRIVAGTLPGDEGPEQPQGLAPIANKIIIHEKERAAPPKIVQQRAFGQHLIRGFGPRHTAIELGNITKLAIKGTPTRELQQHRAIRAHGDEIIAGEGRLGDGRLSWGR